MARRHLIGSGVACDQLQFVADLLHIPRHHRWSISRPAFCLFGHVGLSASSPAYWSPTIQPLSARLCGNPSALTRQTYCLLDRPFGLIIAPARPSSSGVERPGPSRGEQLGLQPAAPGEDCETRCLGEIFSARVRVLPFNTFPSIEAFDARLSFQIALRHSTRLSFRIAQRQTSRPQDHPTHRVVRTTRKFPRRPVSLQSQTEANETDSTNPFQ